MSQQKIGPSLDSNLDKTDLDTTSNFQSSNHQDSIQIGIQTNQTTTFGEKLKNFNTFITKHAIISTAIMLLAVSTTTVSAMEVFNAPESRPSRILGIRKPTPAPTSSVSNNNTNTNNLKIQPLVADSEHDVAVIEECDLAVRFKKGAKFASNKNVSGYTDFVFGSYNANRQSLEIGTDVISCNSNSQDGIIGLSNMKDFW